MIVSLKFDMFFDLKKSLKEEVKRLASYAMTNTASKGRLFKERAPENRLPFQKDRDRIIHCKAFRRLNEKTQVFTAGTGDHYRTRLTHSLEVAQVSRDICRLLGLNEDLGETIALAHDLGHTAFGHAGQDVLHEIMEQFDLHFEHNEQSKRIVEKLEKLYPEFDGLNVSIEVLDGLIKHHTPWDQPLIKFESSPHLEAQVINLADEIAYTCHDIDDGIRSSIIHLHQLKGLKLWDRALELTEKKHGKIADEEILRFRAISSLLSFLIMDVCKQSAENLSQNSIRYLDDVRGFKGMLITFSDKTKIELSELRGFLYKNFYLSDPVKAQFDRAREIMKTVFDYYLRHSAHLPQKYLAHVKMGDKIEVIVKDYVAGMTDGFLVEEFERISNL